MRADIKTAFERFTPEAQETLLQIRELILDVARDLEVGPLDECLKWGEPAYLTSATRSGTTIRLGQPKGHSDKCALFVHCQTSLIAEFRETIDDPAITFEGNRATVIQAGRPIPSAAIRHCIAQALTYKRR